MTGRRGREVMPECILRAQWEKPVGYNFCFLSAMLGSSGVGIGVVVPCLI